MSNQNTIRPGRFDLDALAASFPDTAETLLLDRYLADGPAASARIFRVYRPTPAHFHRGSDEHLYVLRGRGILWLEDPANASEFAPGHLLVFPRGTVHAMPEILEEPVVFLAIDAPRRDPTDVIFVRPEEGTAASFITEADGA